MLSEEYFIGKTFELAARAEGKVSPNPQVGAIIVRGGKVISRGYHKRAGLAHAEINAIKNAKQSLKGATLYVNLEPCCCWGRTRPCVDEVISSGITKVVIATADPNPKVKGRSIIKMRHAGIKVKIGLLKKQAERLNEVFFKNMRSRLPFIVVKSAQSLDGKIATRTNQSRWITSACARKFSRNLRDKYDAVAVGLNTVIEDNPSLQGLRTTPYKIVFDPGLGISLRCRLVREYHHKLIIFYAQSKDVKKIKLLSGKNIKVFCLGRKKGYFNLNQALRILYRLNIMSIFVEGGAFTVGSFFDEELVDKLYFFLSPKIIGGRRALSSVGAEGIADLRKAVAVNDLQIKKIGKDMLITGYPVYSPRKFPSRRYP